MSRSPLALLLLAALIPTGCSVAGSPGGLDLLGVPAESSTGQTAAASVASPARTEPGTGLACVGVRFSVVFTGDAEWPALRGAGAVEERRARLQDWVERKLSAKVSAPALEAKRRGAAVRIFGPFVSSRPAVTTDPCSLGRERSTFKEEIGLIIANAAGAEGESEINALLPLLADAAMAKRVRIGKTCSGTMEVQVSMVHQYALSPDVAAMMASAAGR